MRELLAISADTFIERWHAGRYDDILDDPAHSDLIYLAMLGGLGEGEDRAMALRKLEGAAPRSEGEAEATEYALPPIRTLTLEESRAHFDETTRKLLAISGDTFIERWYAGRYDDILDDPAHSDIMYLTLLGNIGRSRRN